MRGFTLIEVLVVIAIAAIATGIAAPQMTKMMGTNRIQTEASALVGDLQFARTEAIKRGATVSVCPSANAQATTPACVTTNTWHNGWIVFADVNSNGVYDSTIDSLPLKVRNATQGGDTITASPQPSPNAVTFNREGFTTNLGSTLVTFTLHTAPSYDPSTRCVLVTFGGKLTTVAKGATCS
jgi:type IV fimbrial biogenesis protein FimT